MQRLANCVALVTGAAGAVGKALAAGFAGAGAAVVLADLRSDRLLELENQLGLYRDRSLALAADVTDEAAVRSLVERSLARFGSIDILANAAFLRSSASIEQTSEEDWRATIGVNLVSAFICAKAVVPAMLAQKHGRIINFTAQEGMAGAALAAPYAAAKAGIIGFSKALALEMAPYRITVNTICMPGGSPNAAAGGGAEACVGPALYLASAAAAYVTGQTVAVQGA
jgi:NAD(P)-dependent dehydrogenase (short-subunit alcohol dehydrogenase family)